MGAEVTNRLNNNLNYNFYRLCDKKDAALFGVASHSKKRPHNIILGRMFNYTVLDMIELGAEGFKPMSEFHNIKVLDGLKPCLLFNGPVWELNEDLKRLKSMFTDFFCREKVKLSLYILFLTLCCNIFVHHFILSLVIPSPESQLFVALLSTNETILIETKDSIFIGQIVRKGAL